MSFELSTTTKGQTIYVDDDYGFEDAEHKITIQAAVDNVSVGGTVFVYNGTYYEDVYINKTIDLTGISRDNTTINATDIGILVENADYVNISGFTIENGSIDGIQLLNSNSSIIIDMKVTQNKEGIELIFSDFNTIYNCSIISNIDGGIFLHDDSNYNEISDSNISMTQLIGLCLWSSHNILHDNYYYKNGWNSIQITGTTDILIYNETINKSWFGGIAISGSQDNTIINVSILNSEQINAYGIFFAEGSNNNTLIDSKLYNNPTNIAFASGPDYVHRYNYVINTTILNSSKNDIWLKYNAHLTVINSTFNKSKTYFEDWMADSTNASLTVQWYLNIDVIDYLGNPVSDAYVKIEDNKNGSYNSTYTTDINGQIKWITLIEYIEQDHDGDTIGHKIYYTPHRVIGWNDTLAGNAYPEPLINESKTITIILYNGTLLELEPGWNLISLPRPPSNTNVETVLQSIEGRYDSAQWYNITDDIDHWKHYHISKPSFLNDLNKLNHTIGFWIYITDPEGTTLVVLGDELSTEQHISLHQGWNLVGCPSKSNKTRDIALNTLNFGSDIDSIWTYNASTRKWVELDDVLDYFEVGQGYWIHSKVEDVWNVPL